MKKSELSEQDIRTKYITPAVEEAGWDLERYRQWKGIDEPEEGLVTL